MTENKDIERDIEDVIIELAVLHRKNYFAPMEMGMLYKVIVRIPIKKRFDEFLTYFAYLEDSSPDNIELFDRLKEKIERDRKTYTKKVVENIPEKKVYKSPSPDTDNQFLMTS